MNIERHETVTIQWLREALPKAAADSRKVYVVVAGIRHAITEVWWQKDPEHANQGYVCIGEDPR